VDFKTLTVREENSSLFITLNNPPINLLTPIMIDELNAVCDMLNEKKDDIRVVVVDSADKDFWIAHFDVNEIGPPRETPPPSLAPAKARAEAGQPFNELQTLTLNWQNLSQLTIAKVDGRCRGGGLEFLLAFDMRFASEDSLFCQPEAEANFLACGGGATRTFLAAGHARAMEILLSARDFSAVEYERYNLINRALPKEELDAYVSALVENLSYRSNAVIGMHRDVSAATTAPFVDPLLNGFGAEMLGLKTGLETGAIEMSISHMKRAGQSREVELDLPTTLASFRDK
jgi:enoyl-CoA hydratase/carnithine racemase